jgi:hypothetical protein
MVTNIEDDRFEDVRDESKEYQLILSLCQEQRSQRFGDKEGVLL